MKLTDEELKRLRLTVTDNCLPDYSSMLTQLVQSEQAAWEAAENQKENNLSLAWEVKRLKEENERLNETVYKTYPAMISDRDRGLSLFLEENGRLKSQLQDALNTIQRINKVAQESMQAKYRPLNTEGLISAICKQAIDRIQEGIQG